MTAVLGKSAAGARLEVDIGRLVASRLLLQANSGGGKSWAIRRLLEQTHGGIQHLLIDSEGEFHTLRKKFDYILSALVNAPRKLWHPALVVVDEAHVFCPQVGSAESAGAVIDLMTRGRKRGYCGVLATQRISKLHKDAAAEANNKMIGRAALSPKETSDE